jgi:HAD superfamily hydrolase (TIGR01509 family)
LSEPFEAILFDNDGVLVDTEPLFFRATQESLATVEVHLSVEDYHDISMRKGRTVFELATAKGVSDQTILDLRARRARRYSELIAEGVQILEGVVETMEALRGVHRTAIVTSSNREHFDEIHAQTGLIPYFEFVLADGDYRQHKPHPEPYLAAAKRMGVDPARCLVIEDTERGLVSATDAGMQCVVIPNALTHTADFRRARARLGSMRELPAMLGLA